MYEVLLLHCLLNILFSNTFFKFQKICCDKHLLREETMAGPGKVEERKCGVLKHFSMAQGVK